jgi:hypothetical protein
MFALIFLNNERKKRLAQGMTNAGRGEVAVAVPLDQRPGVAPTAPDEEDVEMAAVVDVTPTAPDEALDVPVALAVTLTSSDEALAEAEAILRNSKSPTD